MVSIAPVTVMLKLVNSESPDGGLALTFALEGGIFIFKFIIAIDGIKKWGSDPDIRKVNELNP